MSICSSLNLSTLPKQKQTAERSVLTEVHDIRFLMETYTNRFMPIHMNRRSLQSQVLLLLNDIVLNIIPPIYHKSQKRASRQRSFSPYDGGDLGISGHFTFSFCYKRSASEFDKPENQVNYYSCALQHQRFQTGQRSQCAGHMQIQSKKHLLQSVT